MYFDLAPVISGLVLLGFFTCIGMIPMFKLIKVREARHELRQGSATKIRHMGGWAIIAFWLMAAWFCGTIIGDWGASGDLEGAIDRSWLRLRILLEIAAALGDSD